MVILVDWNSGWPELVAAADDESREVRMFVWDGTKLLDDEVQLTSLAELNSQLEALNAAAEVIAQKEAVK